MEHTFDDHYWNDIWTGDRAVAMSTSEPNPHLQDETRDLKPGTALDAGCGAGAEAIWLASQGWTVTGADISPAALAFAEERAAAAGLAGRVEWTQADLAMWEPGTTFDLVTTQYAHPAMQQLEFYDRIAEWVAPGGTLLIVGHVHGHDSPDEASATAENVTARFGSRVWEVVTAEESQRTAVGPGGHETVLHDVVVRLARSAG